MRWLNRMTVLGLLTLSAPAVASPQYTITLSNSGEYYSGVPFRRDAVTPNSPFSVDGTQASYAFAGPGWVKSYARVDANFLSGLSSGNSGTVRSRAQTDDFVISGPPGQVTGTLHWHVRALLDRLGGFAGNGGHQAHLAMAVSVNFQGLNGSVTYGNAGLFADGALSSFAGSSVDAPVDITSDFPVGSPLLVTMYVESDEYTYGNSSVSPAYCMTDAGGMSDGYAGNGLRLEEVGGQVMTLPAGYTLNSASWGIVDNHFTNLSGVPSGELLGARLDLSSPNPGTGAVRLALELARPGDVRVRVYDVSGRALRTLLDGRCGAGTNAIAWDARDSRGDMAPSGVYFVRAEVEGRLLTRKILHVR